MRNILLFLCLVSIVLFSDCSGCSKSGRDRQRNESKYERYTEEEVNKKDDNRNTEEKPKIVEEDTDGYRIPKRSSTNRPKLSITEIVKKAEPAVFLVNTFDEYGNGLGMGTGFFIESSGIGVSNYHVFDGGSEWTIQTSNQKQYKVTKIIESSEEFDYIIFQVETRKKFPKLEIATIRPEKGEDIIVLGNPKGLESTLTRGIISSIRDVEPNDNALLQIDAAISPGSSGSPVMNMKGEVVGIATMKILECENCNFAMNIEVLD